MQSVSDDAPPGRPTPLHTTSGPPPEGPPTARHRKYLAPPRSDRGEDQLLRRCVELADLDASITHDRAIERLSVSRATYFRHLRQARERVAATLVDQAQQTLQT